MPRKIRKNKMTLILNENLTTNLVTVIKVSKQLLDCKIFSNIDLSWQ